MFKSKAELLMRLTMVFHGQNQLTEIVPLKVFALDSWLLEVRQHAVLETCKDFSAILKSLSVITLVNFFVNPLAHMSPTCSSVNPSFQSGNKLILPLRLL